MNKVITTQGNVQFQFPDGKIVNVHPNHIYTVFNEDTVSFILVGLPKTSGLSTMTSKAEDLELNGTVYSFAELPNAVSEAFAIAGAQARCEIVDELPETGYTNTIYLVPQPAPQTGFDEYVYILDQGWELIGDTSIEMDNYVLKTVFSGYTADTAVIINNEISARTASDTALDNKIDALSASTDEAISGLTDAIDAEETARETADGVISGAVDTVSSGLTEEVQRAQNAESGLSDAIDAVSGNVETEEARAISAETTLDNKIDAVSAATDAALANKQNLLIAGENITISSTTSGDVISAEVDSITIDPSLDSGSTNPVANSAITTAIDSKQNVLNTGYYGGVGSSYISSSQGGIWDYANLKKFVNSGNTVTQNGNDKIYFTRINGKSLASSINPTFNPVIPNLSLVETSAITTSVTSASTDSEIPTAKAIYDELAAIDVKFIDDAKYELSGSTHVINFYNGDVVKATIDCSDFIIDGMVDNVYIENGYLVIDFNTESGKQDIQIPLTDIFNPNNYYTKSETSGATELSTEFATKLNTADFNTYSGSVDTRLAEDEEVTSRALNALNEAVSGKVSTSDFEVYSAATDAALANKQNLLIAGENIIISSTTSGDVISSEGGGKAIEAGIGISITTGETADTVSFNLPISAGTGTNSLVVGNNNNEVSGRYSVAIGSNNKINNTYSFAAGSSNRAIGEYSVAIGNSTEATENNSFAVGQYAKANGFVSMSLGRQTITNNMAEFACGQDNVSNKASNTYGDSGNTLFSVGNGVYNGTRHNAFEIRQNGDIYITSGNTDIKLQDALGGSSYTAGRGIDITNDTISVSLPISAGIGEGSIIGGFSGNTASQAYSLAEGYGTKAEGQYSHAEGYYTEANSSYAHSEGVGTKSYRSADHSEGDATVASGGSSHAEGYYTTTKGLYSHAEGAYTTAIGQASHAEGSYTSALTYNSHTEGYYTKTTNESEHTSGQFNVSSSASTTFGDSGNTLFSVGNGTSSSARHNAFEIRQNGDIYFEKNGSDVKLQDVIPTTTSAVTSGSTDVVTSGGVYEALGGMKIVKLTESEYAALVTKDSNTLYVVIPDPTNP